MDSISITKHTVKNHAGFKGELTIELHPEKPTVIFGINGAGKTSLLNSMYFSNTHILSKIATNTFYEFLPHSTISIGKFESVIKTTIIVKEEKEGKYEFNFKGEVSKYEEEKREEYVIQVINSINGEKSIGKGFDKLVKKLISNYGEKTKILPLFRYFHKYKVIHDEDSLVSSPVHNKLGNRGDGYMYHAKDSLSIKDVTDFVISQYNLENQYKVENQDLEYEYLIAEYIRETLNNFTTILYNSQSEVRVRKSQYFTGQCLILTKGEKQIEFIQLSSGEKYVFAMILELIYRNVMLNSDVEDLKNTPGIVLIDEVESHLHPRWQLTILDALQASFPKVQFIVSSHSPLVASSVRKEQIVALNNFEVVPKEDIPDIYSGSANEMLRQILFSGYQIDTFDKERKEIDSFIISQKYEEAEDKLTQVKEKVDAYPKWIEDFERKIAFVKKKR